MKDKNSAGEPGGLGEDVKQAFDCIKAEEQLKQTTLQYIAAHNYSRKKRFPGRHLMRFAAVAAMLLFVFMGGAAYFTAYAYVDIEVNPAIELTLNRFDRVIGARAYNEDGKGILQTLRLQNKSSDDAVNELMHAMESHGYIIDGGLVSVALRANNESAALELAQSVRHCMSEHSGHQPALEIYPVSEEIKQQANALNISAAKYLAILELQEADPTVEAGHCTNYSIGELREQTRMCHHNNGIDEPTPTEDITNNGESVPTEIINNSDNDDGCGHGRGHGNCGHEH